MSYKKLKTIFHHIVQGSASEDLPRLKRSGYELGAVLQALEKTQDIRRIFRKIKPQEIVAAEAWRARFGADVTQPMQIPAGQRNAVLLDECISYAILADVTRMFGFSTHVAGEGMIMNRGCNSGKAREMDRIIYDFAVAHNFGILLTRDSDFTSFAKNNKADLGRGPAILYVPAAVRENEEALLRRHRANIERLIDGGPGGLYHLNSGGITPAIV